jgi:ABC-type amino acid transport substrate-binding protein
MDTLRVGYTPAPPFIVEKKAELSGIIIWLWKKVAKDLNLKYDWVPMGFTEMLDSLATGGIDISINPLTITGSRSRIMEFTHSFYAANSTVAVAESSSFEKFVQFVRSFSI